MFFCAKKEKHFVFIFQFFVLGWLRGLEQYKKVYFKVHLFPEYEIDVLLPWIGFPSAIMDQSSSYVI